MDQFVSSLQDLFGQLGDKVAGWGSDLVLMLPNIAAATLVLIATWYLSKLIATGACKLLRRAHTHTSLRNLIYKIVRVAVLLVGMVVSLQILNLDKAATTFLAGAGIVGLALGFAFQDLSANFIAGVLLAVRRPMAIGDMVETNGLYGKVEAIQLRSTSLRQPDGKLVIVPNRSIFENQLINFSEAGKLRVEIPVGVSYNDDLEVAHDAALEAIRATNHLEDEPLDVLFTEFGDSSINLVARFWVSYANPADLIKARSQAIMRIKSEFDERGISIPFPIRTLELSEDSADLVRAQPLEEAA